LINQYLSLDKIRELTPPEAKRELPRERKSAPSNLLVDGFMPKQYAEYALRVLSAYAASMKDALTCFKPLPSVEDFYSSMDRIRLLAGSNQAGKMQLDSEPVLTPSGWRPIGELAPGDAIIGGDGCECKVTAVFKHKNKQTYRVTFDEGTSTVCGGEHLWKVCEGPARFGKNRGNETWSVVDTDSLRGSCKADGVIPPIDRAVIPVCDVQFSKREHAIHPYLLGCLIGDGGMSNNVVMITTADDEILRSVESLIPPECSIKLASKISYRIRGMVPYMRSLGLQGKRSYEKHIPEEYLYDSYENRLELLRGLMDTDGTVGNRADKSGIATFTTTSPQLARDMEFLVRSLGGKCKARWRVTKYTHKGIKKEGRPSTVMTVRMPHHCPFKLERKAKLWKAPESTTKHRVIHSITPDVVGDCTCITVDSPDSTYITRDFIVTHNTVHAVAEFARIVRGMDPFNKLPKDNLKVVSVARDEDQIGRVIWGKLCVPGAFEVIRDELTGAWRSVRPDPNNPKETCPIDLSRKSEWRPSPPLLPASSLASISYKSKAEAIPSFVQLDNGTEILFCTSNGRPKQGIQLHLAHFDEEIENKMWFEETLPRLLRFNGIFMWSATPQSSTPQFYELHKRVLAGEEGISEYTLLIDDNPYIPRAAKDALFRDYQALGDDVLQVRWYGKYAIQGRAVYPTFSKTNHGTHPFEPPDDWMRVMVVDPGSQYAAALFGAVPPSCDALHIYNEVECRNEDAAQLARRCAEICKGHRFEAFLIDKQAGGQRSMGRSNRVCDHYTECFEASGIRPCRISGHGWTWACNVPESREMSVKRMMNTGKLKFHLERVAKTCDQVTARYYDKRNTTRRESRTVHDLCDCLEYMCAFFDEKGLYYNAPPSSTIALTPQDLRVYKEFEKRKKIRSSTRWLNTDDS